MNTEQKRNQERKTRVPKRKKCSPTPRMMDDPINAPSAAVTGSLLLSPPHFPTGCVPYTKKKKTIFPSLFYTHFTPKENGTEKEPRGGKKRTPVRSPFYIWRKGNRRDTRLSIVLPLTAGSISQTHSSLH